MKNVLLLLAGGFEFFEASAFLDVLGWNLVDGDGNTRITGYRMKKKFTSTFGITSWNPCTARCCVHLAGKIDQ